MPNCKTGQTAVVANYAVVAAFITFVAVATPAFIVAAAIAAFSLP